MKIAFFSNFLNHHQAPFCEALLKIEKIEFKFVQMEEMPAERISMGYKVFDKETKYLVKGFENIRLAKEIALTYDVVIFGNCDENFVAERMKLNKLTFRYIERLFKKGFWHYFIPKVRAKIFNKYLKYKNNPNFYILCASGFTSFDITRVGFPKEKCLTFGYFPSISLKTYDELLAGKKTKKTILYCGRLLKLKHVETLLKAYSIVEKENTNVELKIVGDGPEKNKLEQIAVRRKIKNLSFCGFLKPEETRMLMEESHIFVMPSDSNEGWAAVSNEALSSAMVLISSNKVGSAPVLIKNNINGLVYRCKKYKELASAISFSLDDENFHRLSFNGYNTVKELFNHMIAANRFYEMCCNLIENNQIIIYDKGPLSISKVYRNNWNFKD